MLIQKWIQPFIGKRLLKTGLAVFITAWICQILDLPVIFAVIAAIVTIEPTVYASITKGIIRLPAAAIGAAIAMSFDFLLGQTPLTFALSAFFTILICHRLGWHDAIIVSTLTAVAMIPMTDDQFFLSFLTRVATTSIGITVSTLVNLIIWSPNFIKEIRKRKKDLTSDIKELITQSLRNKNLTKTNNEDLNQKAIILTDNLQQINEMLILQHDVHKFRKRKQDLKTLYEIEQQVELMQKLVFHSKNIISYSNKEVLPSKDARILEEAWLLIQESFYDDSLKMELNQVKKVRTVLSPLIENQATVSLKIDKSTMISLELLSIYHLLLEFQYSKNHPQQ
ncbi:hypothetical protein BTS2_2921 [Bacillus sp. TS-2]|nr:hypothetical protein BTS2_2921 [Bacillus sp. TS-2]